MFFSLKLYNFEGNYNQILNSQYEAEYPHRLIAKGIKAGRYTLTVGMIQSHWQGSILLQQAQVISKTLDISKNE